MVAWNFFEKEAEERGFVCEKVKGGRKSFELKSVTGRSKTFQVKTSDSSNYGCDACYTVREESFKFDFLVFGFKKAEMQHYIIVPSEELQRFIERFRQFDFALNLIEGGKVDVFSRGNDALMKKKDYSEYLDDKGWRLVKEALV